MVLVPANSDPESLVRTFLLCCPSRVLVNLDFVFCVLIMVVNTATLLVISLKSGVKLRRQMSFQKTIDKVKLLATDFKL